MVLGPIPVELFLPVAFALVSGAGVVFVALTFLRPRSPISRLRSLDPSSKPPVAQKQSVISRLVNGPESRRKQLQEKLKQIEDREKQRRQGVDLKKLLERSGLDVSVRLFWIFSALTGLVLFMIPYLFGFPVYVSVIGGVVGLLLFPRWALSVLAKRRQEKFLDELAEAIDVIVRGLRSGLPISDAMKIIATETGPPVGPEFLEVVEGQRVGISLEQGIERMFDRMPLAEVNFLAIVISIQSKTGGNLSEALGNLSKVLRDRKKMKGKIRAMSQEAKSSAAIIGALPFLLMGILSVVNPTYLIPLFTTQSGQYMLAACGVWMLIGILAMRKMMNFDI